MDPIILGHMSSSSVRLVRQLRRSQGPHDDLEHEGPEERQSVHQAARRLRLQAASRVWSGINAGKENATGSAPVCSRSVIDDPAHKVRNPSEDSDAKT